ncbi:uncharacterized protein LOC110454204, partial [Mizuhopecten yessoensis]|uniref:uncharacterized protein LOC110454204 n=1 Tax=Mizuhopecten yessoensis TaxID=6573 RepID=UPI000B45B79A
MFAVGKLILTATFIFKTVLLVDGHGLCASSAHVDQESNAYYKSFKQLHAVGVLQCIKVCKRYNLCKKCHHNREQMTCDLLMTYAEKGNVTSLLDVQSVQMESSSCSHDTCSESEVCVSKRNGHHVCVGQSICPSEDWIPFNHKCYLFVGCSRSGDESEEFCKARNASPVRIDNAMVNDFIKSQMAER